MIGCGGTMMMEKYAAADTMWVLIGAFMVFFMQPGFAMVETGFTRAKNAGNIVMKNFMDLCLGSIVFWIIGFDLMFGTDIGGLIGAPDFFVQNDYGASYPSWAFLSFKLFSVLRRRLLYQVLWPNGRSFLFTVSTVF